MSMAKTAALFTVALASLAQATTYGVTDTFIGSSFYSGFTAQAIGDPTNGRVNYVDGATAQNLNLTYANGNTFILRSDFTTTLNPSGPGRNSVRLSSNKQYGNSLLIADIRHMPQGCGTWPALWSFGSNWPYDGEIDILEGVNDQSPNQATLHTGSGCTMTSSRAQTGTITGNDCNAADNGNSGCGVRSTDSASYGPNFNNNGGGCVPAAVKNGASTADSSTFGEPFALFTNDQCDIPSHFGNHNIIINLTFCGDWAGQAAIYNGAGCPGSCVDYVNNNPSAFSNAYFNFAALRVYTPGSTPVTTSSAHTTTTTPSAPKTTTSAASSGGKCAGVAAWSSSVAYNGGSLVTYNGQLWKNSWWSEADTPGGAAGVWVSQGSC